MDPAVLDVAALPSWAVRHLYAWKLFLSTVVQCIDHKRLRVQYIEQMEVRNATPTQLCKANSRGS